MGKYNIFVTILLIGFLVTGWFGFRHYQSELNKNKAIVTELQMQGDLSKGRANTIFIESKTHLKELAPEIQKDIKDRDAKLNTVGKIETKYEAAVEGALITGPTIVEKSRNDKCVISSLPFSYQDFRLKAYGDIANKTFNYKLTQKFEIIFAETKLSSGAVNNYAELYELDQSNKRVGRMELVKFDVYKSPTDPKVFKFWDPAIDIMVGAIMNRGYEFDINGNIGISFFSWGRYRNLDWRFLRLATGINRSGVEFSISPAQYNVAQPLPIINNLWLTPSFGYVLDTKSYYLGFGIAAQL